MLELLDTSLTNNMVEDEWAGSGAFGQQTEMGSKLIEGLISTRLTLSSLFVICLENLSRNKKNQ